MKTTIFLMFSFIFIMGSLFGQKDKQFFIDSDIRKQFFPITSLDSPQMRKPYLDLYKKLHSPTFRDLDRVELFQDRSSYMDNNFRPYTDIVVAEEFPGASKYFARMPNLIYYPYEKSFVIKPDTTVKQYLIIIDPTQHLAR